MALKDLYIKFFEPAATPIIEGVSDYYHLVCRKLRDSIWWVRYRTINQNHKLHIRSLRPGYYDKDTVLLHVSFQLLQDYVERELYDEAYAKDGPVSRDRGLAYLNWAINDADCKMGTAPTQSDRAKEFMTLYLWWVDYRPARLEPWGAEEIWQVVDLSDDISKGLGAPRSKEYQDASDRAAFLEQFYEQEDTEMLTRLAKVRTSLWT